LAGRGGTVPDRQAIVNAITTGYTTLKAAATLYTALPPCTDGVATRVCSNPAISREIVKALAVADVAVAEAKAQILAATDQSSVEKWSAYALAAVDVLAKALATYGVKT
jgi:hypothetical protein